MTDFTEVYDRFLKTVKDYNLNKLYDESAPSYKEFYLALEGFIIRAITASKPVNEDLSFTLIEATPEDSFFNNTLEEEVIKVVNKNMVAAWFEEQRNDTSQFELHLQNADFKLHSEANNLKEKNVTLDKMREDIDYDIKSYKWRKWLGVT